MVLEYLGINMKEKPKFLVLGMLYFGVALAFSFLLFDQSKGLFTVFFTVLAAVPFFYRTIEREEEFDIKHRDEKNLLTYHSRTIGKFLMFFVGVMIAVIITVIILSPAQVQDTFDAQVNAIENINPTLAENLFSITGNSVSGVESMFDIFLSNIGVLVACIVFSMIYGLGALYVITWNATVIGVAIAALFKTELAALSGFGFWSALSVLGSSLLRFSLHALPEIIAFIIAGLAGGIISVAVIRHHLASEEGLRIMKDAFVLVGLSVGLLLIAAVIEVYVSPFVYSLF
ncbi:MAG: stage II sporulation protein M [Nanobdellota archaeon]